MSKKPTTKKKPKVKTTATKTKMEIKTARTDSRFLATGPLPTLSALIIENVSPMIDGGRYPAKCEVGDKFVVEADIFRDGHSIITAELKFRKEGETRWQITPMEFYDNDRWRGYFVPTENTTYVYTIEAWTDLWTSWQNEIKKKHSAGEHDLASEITEGVRLIEAAARRASDADRKKMHAYAAKINPRDDEGTMTTAFDKTLALLMAKYPDRSFNATFSPILKVTVDRVLARFAAWYEMFHRSMGTVPGKSATWDDCIKRLPEIEDLGFDVIYLPPIHPIGVTNRKGKNNALKAAPGEPGSPWAIGNVHGGHKAVNPELGTLEDFRRFVRECRKRNMEVAIDFALNCSPDHPYVKEHPEWFYKRPDGTLKYAENPPKKYQDIYPLNLYCDDHEGLWKELLSVFLFWIEHGVTIFRVDNPHTKPVVFWEWLIREVQSKHPETIFLAEAFTRPKMMKVLAKAGFTQSYTYFTWRNNKTDLTDYLTELTQTDMRHYYRGNFFANTPDILPIVLQQGGRAAFKMRFALAATLSSVYGIYSSYELCENAALPGKEEYDNSEKYEYKVWDWNRPGNIKDYIKKINAIRRANPALWEYDNVRFFQSDNDDIIFYGKATADKHNIILVAVNLNPFEKRSSFVHVPLWEFGMSPDDSYEVLDLLTDERYQWSGVRNYIELDPQKEPAHIFLLKR